MLSIHQRILLSGSVFVALILSLAGLTVLNIYSSRLEAHLRQSLLQYHYALLGAFREDSQGLPQLPQTLTVPAFNTPDGEVMGYVFIPASDYHWQSISAVSRAAVLYDFAVNLAAHTDAPQQLFSVAGDYLRLQHILEWEDREQNLQKTVIILDLSRHQSKQLQHQFIQQLILTLLLSLVIIGIIQALILRHALQPIRRLGQELLQIQKGKSETISRSYPSELNHFAQKLNQLLAHNREQLQKYRQSLADLSHSLKTPLAVLQGEIHQSGTFPPLIHQQIEKMDKTIAYHLQRASIAGQTTGVNVKIALAPLCDEILTALAKVYSDKNLQVQCDIADGLCLPLEQGDVFELLGNLLDNAFKYAAHTVSLSAAYDKNTVLLRIFNDGGPISSLLLDQICQRGVRDNHETNGQGIGLSIVSEIMAQYNADMEINNCPATDGVEVKICFKLTQ